MSCNSYSLISFNFYLFYFSGAAAEPLGSARGALTAPRSTGWEPLVYCIKWKNIFQILVYSVFFVVISDEFKIGGQ